MLDNAAQARAFSELVIPMPERLMRDEMVQYEHAQQGTAYAAYTADTRYDRLAPGMAT